MDSSAQAAVFMQGFRVLVVMVPPLQGWESFLTFNPGRRFALPWAVLFGPFRAMEEFCPGSGSTPHVVPVQVGVFRGMSRQPSAQLLWIPCAMPYGNHFDLEMGLINRKENGVRPSVNPRFAAFGTSFGKTKWLAGNGLHHLVHLMHEANPKAIRLSLIPSNSFPEFKV